MPKTQLKKKRSPAMLYAVRYKVGAGVVLHPYHFFFVNFKNRTALCVDGQSQTLSYETFKNRFFLLPRDSWKWVSEEEAYKIIIGGYKYVQDNYHKTKD